MAVQGGPERQSEKDEYRLMESILILITASAVSIAVIPVMVRLAPYLGMLDHPASRKVHDRPIPRVGGWGIVVGALVSTAIWVGIEPLVLTYALGALVLFGFGVLDDYREQPPAVKFLGQFIAVVPLVTVGGLQIQSLPYGIGAIPALVSIPFTIFALLGMINAINHSDGLDGLAGGESLLSFAGIALLLYGAGGADGVALALASVGGVLGFLRFNTHPASLFMGDGGSQFLGYTLGFLAILLTQRVDPALSSSVVLLLLGLPIADILVVLYKRIRGGMHWFLATKNHVHHRLLDLGFVHQESVVIIYSVQSAMVVSGLLLREASDWLITGVYLGYCAVLFGTLRWCERRQWRAHRSGRADPFWGALRALRRSELMVVAPRRFIGIAIPLFLILGSVGVSYVPRDFGLASAVAAVAMVLESFRGGSSRSFFRRALIYIIVAFVLYLHSRHDIAQAPWHAYLESLFFLSLALSVVVAVRFSPRRRRYEFEATAMDYLLVVLVAAALALTHTFFAERLSAAFIVQLAIMFYACELLVIEHRERWDGLGLSSFATAIVLAVRGLF